MNLEPDATKEVVPGGKEGARLVRVEDPLLEFLSKLARPRTVMRALSRRHVSHPEPAGDTPALSAASDNGGGRDFCFGLDRC